jgi:hypothetical protein
MLSSLHLQIAIESLDFGEESRLGKILVEDSNRIVRIECSNLIVACLMDGLQMSWRYKACGAN